MAHKPVFNEQEEEYAKQAIKTGVGLPDICSCILFYRIISSIPLNREIIDEGPMRVQRELTEINVGVVRLYQNFAYDILTKAVAEVEKEEIDEHGERLN